MVQAAKNLEKISSPIREAIVFVSRPSIRPLLKQELKAAGIETIHTCENPDACIEQLVLSSAALLVADTEHDAKELSTVLSAARGSFNVDTRPIMLITQTMTPQIVSYASEYNIARIHCGEISRSSVHADLQAITEEEKDENGIRNTMIRIADARMRGDWDMSEFLLLDLYGRYPGDARIACELAENYINKDDWQQAEAIIESIQDGEANIRVMHMKARYLMHNDNYAEAEEILQSCKLINPYNVDRLVDLGVALMNMSRVQEALENFELALEIDIQRQDAFEGKVQCKLLAGDVNEALTLMRQITSPRELASLFNNAAILSIRQGHFNNGMQLYKTAIGTIGKKEKATARLFYNLGIAYMKFSHQTEALSCFEKAAGIDGTFRNAKYNANIIAVKLGLKPPFPDIKPELDKRSRKPSGIETQERDTPYDFADNEDEEDVSRNLLKTPGG
jgi:tetratricopeptide (TPR) repeat protein